MRNKIIFIIFAVVIASACSYSFEYFTYRMNFEPGSPEQHVQEIEFVGNLTITLPSGFSFVSSTDSYTSSGNEYTWISNTTKTINYTIQSPGSCTEGDLFRSQLYEDSVLMGEFVYVCIYDTKAVDYKIEYGHGCGNYLAEDEPYIPNESATLFNLLRVWNIGNYLDPDEDATNASITCWYGDYPVRTYGRADIGYEDSGVNASFGWSIIYGGYWFRIGVVSQDIPSLETGSNYTVNCTELTYDFEHERVVAGFPNYSLEVRSPYPFIRTTTSYGSKDLVTLTNSEKYAVYSVMINYALDDFSESSFVASIAPGESVTYVADAGTNITASYIPSWQRHCFSPVYYSQELSNQTAGNTTANNPPDVVDIPSQAWLQNTSNNDAFDLDDYFSDPENDTLSYSYSGNVNINITIDPVTNEVSFTQNSNFTGIEYVVFSAYDGNNTSYSNNVTLVVYPSNGTVTETVTIVERGGGGKKKIYVYVPVNVTQNITEYVRIKDCREIWKCTEWPECGSEGFINRSCIDINNCGTTFFMPQLMQYCNYTEPKVEQPAEVPFDEGEFCTACMIIPVLLIIMFIVILVLILTEEFGKKDEVKKWRRKKPR